MDLNFAEKFWKKDLGKNPILLGRTHQKCYTSEEKQDGRVPSDFGALGKQLQNKLKEEMSPLKRIQNTYGTFLKKVFIPVANSISSDNGESCADVCIELARDGWLAFGRVADRSRALFDLMSASIEFPAECRHT